MRCIARAVSYRLHPTNVFTRAVPYRYLPANILQVLLDHTNEECICRGTDLDHGIGNRDLICLMCAKSKFPSGSFKLQNSARWSLKKINKLPGYHKPTIVADLWFLSTRSKELSSTDFPAGAGPGRDISLGGVGELSGVSMDCIAPVSQEYVLVQAS